jgi:hypothetical protein
MITMYKKHLTHNILFCALFLFSCSSGNNVLDGTWVYEGGIYNGKKESAAADYDLQRTYAGNSYEGHLIEEGMEPEKYDGGNFELKDSLYLETTTFSSQPSQLLNKTVTYSFSRSGDLFIIKGSLPSGMLVEEYWRKIK